MRWIYGRSLKAIIKMVAIEIRYFGNLDAISTQVVYKMEKL